MASMAFLIPRPCPMCGVEMQMKDFGLKCPNPNCAHEIYVGGVQKKCACAKCAAKGATETPAGSGH